MVVTDAQLIDLRDFLTTSAAVVSPGAELMAKRIAGLRDVVDDYQRLAGAVERLEEGLRAAQSVIDELRLGR